MAAAKKNVTPAPQAGAGLEQEGRPRSRAGVNEVRLIGRISGTATERVLPSGDVVTQVRLVVARDAAMIRRGARSGSAHPVTVDTIDVACWRKPLQRKLARLPQDSIIEVVGSLTRRFWRSPMGPASRYEVEATKISLVAREDPLGA